MCCRIYLVVQLYAFLLFVLQTDSKLLDTLFDNVTRQKEKCQESGSGQRMTVSCCPLSGSCDISPVYKNENLSFYNSEEQKVIKESAVSCRTEEELRESFSHVSIMLISLS